MGRVKVSVEAFGGEPLVREFEGSELKNKSVEQMLRLMVSERWNGKNMVVSNAIGTELSTDGGYAVRRKTGGEGMPVRYEPVQLGANVRQYEVIRADEPEIHLAVSGHHVAGYK